MSADGNAICPRCYPDSDEYDPWDLREYHEFYHEGGAIHYSYHSYCRSCGFEITFGGKYQIPGLEIPSPTS